MKTLICSVISFIAGVAFFAAPTFNHPDRAADEAAIRAHIGSIFQAFIDGDEQKIFDTHSEDWRGLLEGYPTPIKGINEYMQANGIDWPKPANAPKSQGANCWRAWYSPRKTNGAGSPERCTTSSANSSRPWGCMCVDYRTPSPVPRP